MFYFKKINLTSINLVVMKEEFEIFCVLFFIRWTNIGLLLPGRTHKDVMNYCKTSYMRYKMSNRGVDPFANKRPRSKSSTASSSASASKKKNIIQEESTSKIPKNQLDGEKSGKLDLHLSLKTPN